MRLTGLFVKVLGVALAGVLMAGLVVLGFGNIRIEPKNTFTAAFTEVSGLAAGSDVRAAGVPIGRIESIELQPDNSLVAEFTVSDQIPVTSGTTATVRFRNLLGDRFLDLGQGPGELLADGGSLPASQTRPALDLDELYNGFTPLFQGLNPDQVNQLSGSLIGVFEGQAGSVQQLLADVGALTNGLADRDQLIGSLITNLNTVLDTANQRAPQLNDLIIQLQTLVTRFAEERGPLGAGIERVNVLAATVADFAPRVGPELTGTITEIGRLSEVINADSADLNDDLRKFPGYYNTLARIGANQSAFSFFICGASLYLGPELGSTPVFPDVAGNGTPRCQF